MRDLLLLSELRLALLTSASFEQTLTLAVLVLDLKPIAETELAVNVVLHEDTSEAAAMILRLLLPF